MRFELTMLIMSYVLNMHITNDRTKKMFMYFNSWIQGALCDIRKGSYPRVDKAKEVNYSFLHFWRVWLEYRMAHEHCMKSETFDLSAGSRHSPVTVVLAIVPN